MNFDGIISLLIACIEWILLINLLIFSNKDKVNVIALTMVALLAGYQTMEFIMCNLGLTKPIFPYLAFVIISYLPPLNLLLILTLTKSNKLGRKIILIFLPAIFFTVYYLFSIAKFEVAKCTVLYASYHYPLGDLYGFFYYLPILISMIILIKTIPETDDKRKKLIFKVLFYSTIFISLPVVIGFSLMFAGSYAVISSMESIMCKFAFVYALSLSFLILYNSPFKDERNYFKYLSGYKQWNS
ncbi:Hypothetical protein IALB_2733 [Ignavibacterium album JCM 16511]|uniref:Histidine kinase N-terminal 7TM region domain-containing protein n=1 Tax=Ignavibacterium album (strain DSM 19864 / JCM 16511 / NBRC 101810 / Mat9-16) TaxID=945713 RepID=I0AN79_IGNAJ|nr:hypothetical protein [Ignavibacterium album]AFH50436.1 Hypothetical protein IALB_2733 [Ignavibacterium album JCM 16511]